MTFNKKSFITEKEREFVIRTLDGNLRLDWFEQSLNEAITKAVESLGDEIRKCSGFEDIDGRWYYESDEIEAKINELTK